MCRNTISGEDASGPLVKTNCYSFQPLVCCLISSLEVVDQSILILLQACVLYILRVGVTDQMTEPTQRSFLLFLGKQVWFSLCSCCFDFIEMTYAESFAPSLFPHFLAYSSNHLKLLLP